MQVTDENGDQWTIAKGDPGYQAAAFLKGLRYQVIMLPLRQILWTTNGPLQPEPTVDKLTEIDSEKEASRYIAYASLLDQWTTLGQAGLHVVD